MNDNGNERLARMEEAITAMAGAIAQQSEAITQQSEVNSAMAAAIKHQSEVTARGLETLVSMHRVLDTRLAVLETQVGEVLVELRSQARHMDDVIVELRAHNHEAA